jgi:hypothetical protein
MRWPAGATSPSMHIRVQVAHLSISDADSPTHMTFTGIATR